MKLLQILCICLTLTPFTALPQSPRELAREVTEDINAQRYQEALNKLETLAPEQMALAPFLYIRSSAHAGLGEIQSMLSDLQSALNVDPTYVPARMALARAAIANSDLDTAREQRDLLKTLITDHSDPRIVELNDRLASAEQAEKEGILPPPLMINSSEDAARTASFLWHGGNKEEAINVLKAWTQGNPEDLQMRMALGDAYSALELEEDAIAEYKAVINADDNNFAAYNNLAWLLRSDDQITALEFASKALELSPQNPMVLDTYATVSHLNDNPEQALNASRKAVELAPNTPSIRLNAAKIELNNGDESIARKHLEQLVNLDDDTDVKTEAEELLSEMN